MKRQYNKSRMLAVGLFSALSLGLFLAIFGLSQAISGVDNAIVAKTPEAILASAGVKDDIQVSLPIAYFDQKADPCVNLYDSNTKKELYERQFEWTSCGYYYKELEQGLVSYELNEDNLPIGLGGSLTSNRGVKDIKRWFEVVDGKSQAYPGTIDLNYSSGSQAEFSFRSNDFYPLDEAKFSSSDAVNSDGHNHLFTMHFAVPFVVMLEGNESFEIATDDDTFVFLDNELIIDMGGIHGVTEGKFVILETGEVYTSILGEELAYSGITLNKSDNSIIRVFHADRDSDESVFRVRFSGMNLNVMQTDLANVNNGIQIAYDPTDPMHVAPLGQSLVVRPDNTKGFIIMATIEAALAIVFIILIVMMIRPLIKRKSEK